MATLLWEANNLEAANFLLKPLRQQEDMDIRASNLLKANRNMARRSNRSMETLTHKIKPLNLHMGSRSMARPNPGMKPQLLATRPLRSKYSKRGCKECSNNSPK